MTAKLSNRTELEMYLQVLKFSCSPGEKSFQEEARNRTTICATPRGLVSLAPRIRGRAGPGGICRTDSQGKQSYLSQEARSLSRQGPQTQPQLEAGCLQPLEVTGVQDHAQRPRTLECDGSSKARAQCNIQGCFPFLPFFIPCGPSLLDSVHPSRSGLPHSAG